MPIRGHVDAQSTVWRDGRRRDAQTAWPVWAWRYPNTHALLQGFLERLPFHRRPQIDQVPADVFRKIPPDARFMARNAHFQRRALFASDAADPPFRPAALAIGE